MKIKVEVNYKIHNGAELVFRSPCEYANIDGLIVTYVDDKDTVSKEFTFVDANVNDLSDLNVLFAKGAVVKVILDVDNAQAFVQNADTNAYLEEQLAGKTPISHVSDDNNPHKVTASQVGAAPAGYGIGSASKQIEQDLNEATLGGGYYYSTKVKDPITGEEIKTQNVPTDLGNGTIFVERYGTAEVFQHIKDVRGRMVERHGQLSGGVWIFDPPEYINPPLFPGTEYRTTERSNGKAVYKKVDYFGHLLYRLDGETEWKYQSYLVGAAPVGLITKDYHVESGSDEDLMTIINDVYSTMKNDTVQYISIGFGQLHPILGGTAYMVKIYRRTASYGFVEAKSYTGIVYMRNFLTEWTEWECENPPMNFGVEYCTTKRVRNQLVYAQWLKCGALPNTGNKGVAIGTLGKSARVVDFKVNIYSASSVEQNITYAPRDLTTREAQGGAYISRNDNGYHTFWITTHCDMSHYTALAYVEYVKEEVI